MSINYYSVLGLKRMCSKIEILNAFQNIVNKFGMEKLNENDTNDRLIAFEAYDVLSNPFWRDLYDQFGDNAIKTGVFVDNDKKIKRYSYHGDIFLTYKSIYGSTNPYAHIIFMLSDRKATLDKDKKLDIIRIPIDLTLNEIFYGTLKKINIPESDGIQSVVKLKVPKGLPANSEIVHEFTDERKIIFITNDLPHKDFVRQKQDLISTYDVTFKEAMSGVQYVIKTLDHKQLRVNITQMITPTYQKIIRGEGMPIYGGNCEERGNIVLKFNIQMPRYLPVMNTQLCETLYKTNIHEN